MISLHSIGIMLNTLVHNYLDDEGRSVLFVPTPLPGYAAHRSGDDWQVLDRRGNPQVFGEEHRRFGDGNGRDFGSDQSDSAWARIGEDFSVGEGRNLP